MTLRPLLAPLAACLALAGCRSCERPVDPEPSRPVASAASLAVAPSAAPLLPDPGPGASAARSTEPPPSPSASAAPGAALELHRVAVLPSSDGHRAPARVHRVGDAVVVTRRSGQAWSLAGGRLVPIARWPGADPRLQATPSGRIDGGEIVRVIGRFPEEYWATVDTAISQGPRYPSIRQMVTFHVVHGASTHDSPPVLAAPLGRGLITVNDARRLRHVGPAREDPSLTQATSGVSERVRPEALATLPSGEVLVAGPDAEEPRSLALERWRPGDGRGAVQRLPLGARARVRLQAAGAAVVVASWDASEWNQALSADAGSMLRLEGSSTHRIMLPEWSTIHDLHLAADGTLWLLLEGGPRGLYRVAPGTVSLQRIELPAGFTAQGLFARDGRVVYVGGLLADVGGVVLSTDPAPLLLADGK